MTFWAAFKRSYSGGVAFILACPFLIAIPIASELLQHVVEVYRGMYVNLGAAKAADNDTVRLGFGLLKVAALALSSYWIVRFLVWRNAVRAAKAETPAVWLFAGVLMFQLALAAIQLFALPRSGGVVLAEAVGGLAVNVLIAAWVAAAALGNTRIGPWQSVRIMAPHLLWSIGLSLVVLMPLMIPHYAFGVLALIGPKPLLWPVLIADALLVGLLTAVLGASGYLIAKRSADHAETPLLIEGKSDPSVSS